MNLNRPHALAPTKQSARVAIFYKNFAANRGVSHIGLGVAALNTQRTLRQRGYWVDVVPANTAAEVESWLARTQASATASHQHPVSHVVISAPWIATKDLQGILMRWPDVHFAVVSHSNVGFLMADPSGIRLLREDMEQVLAHHNFALAGNSQKFVDAWAVMYGRGMQWLPNLYDVTTIASAPQQPWRAGAPLRIGVFGACRPLKNMVTAVASCVYLAQQLRADVEVLMNTGRDEGGGTVRQAVQQLVTGLRNVKLVEVGWQTWPSFRSVVRTCNLLVSPSYTESFNMVTADGVAEGVASVTSDAIDWVPSEWVGPADDVAGLARVARRLLGDSHAVAEGQQALRQYVDRGSLAWEQYLGDQ